MTGGARNDSDFSLTARNEFEFGMNRDTIVGKIYGYRIMKNVEIIAKKLAAIWQRVYVVGSYNVHAILKKNFWADIDLTTPALPDQIRSVLKVVWEIWSKYWTLIVREGGESYEITTFRKDIGSVNQRKPVEVIFTPSLEEDAKRRDFTFNAIYYDPLEKRYHDPTWGLKDLKKWIIRFVWDINKRLDEDILRLLRYVRLKNKYYLKPASGEYEEILKERTVQLLQIAKERIKQELDKMFLDKTNISALEDLKKIWFFKHYLPQVDNLGETPWGKLMHLEWNVWVHTLMSINELNHLHLHDIDLYWATLFHDIGKYPTFKYDDYWNIHYYRHEFEGVKIVRDFISRQMLFSKDSLKKILWLIENHIRVWTIEDMKKIKRYRFMMHDNFQDLIYLYIVDNLGKDPPDTECGPRLQKIYDDFKAKLKYVRFLDWNDIMNKYPNLQWGEIGKRLRVENDKILSRL
ncbi:MAG: polynucleotide adenylyltransferase/metal dependent phosphohydrolase [uncultured bacterium (gcode 4)]|uniref:Polynucleotide adenylyltransferase/metal dependent phosphohydrolase n=1 Tax=uncultured bacterium (gcode 4) TaxID=1234023 RepID=K2G034_9BACT|nr:MAG: polynucleotide adenylyltransferase/metal dependent phosphohydrolase [uncultured bacterium (gcode 4)]